jgi:hypothetical protein
MVTKVSKKIFSGAEPHGYAFISLLKVLTNEKRGGLKLISLSTASQPDVYAVFANNYFIQITETGFAE